MTRAKIIGSFLGFLTAASMGCQNKPQFVPVEGTVTQRGNPLSGVIVDFYPDSSTSGPRSTSEPTGEAGHYRLRSTRNGNDGAVVGLHRVCILDIRNGGRNLLDPLLKKAMNAKEVQEKVEQFKIEVSASPRVPPSYGRPNETPLRVEVHPGPQIIDLEVK